MNDIIKLGIVGFGRIVELLHLPLLKQLPQIEISGIYDVTPQRAALAAKRGFTLFSNLEDLFNSSIDAVLIATPPNSHYEIAIQALQHGKHLLIEKPVTLTADEVIKLREVADSAGKSVTVFQNRRFDSDYLFVKKLIAEGSLGPILFVERRHDVFGSGASFGVKSFHQEWRNEKNYGGGALLDWGVHLIDQLLQLKLGKITEVRGTMKSLWSPQAEVDDYVHASISTDRNVRMSMEVNFASAAASPLWVIGGEQATVQVISDRQAKLYIPGKPPQEMTIETDSSNGPLQIYSAFCDAILHGGKLVVTLEEAIETMRILDRIRASS